jgi:hypothetical protein
MIPQIGSDPPDFNERLELVPCPEWMAGAEDFTGGAQLHLLHPAYGWLGFAIYGPELVELRDAFSEIVRGLESDSSPYAN